MKRTSIAVAVLVALALTGCAATSESAPSEPEQAATTTAEQTPEASPEPAPVEVTPTATPDPTLASDDELLNFAHATLDVAGIELTDAEVLSAVAWICEQRAAGVERPIALEGASEGTNYGFQAVAEQMRCPEYFQTY